MVFFLTRTLANKRSCVSGCKWLAFLQAFQKNNILTKLGKSNQPTIGKIALNCSSEGLVNDLEDAWLDKYLASKVFTTSW